VDHPATGNAGDHAIKSTRIIQSDDAKILKGKVVSITDGDTVTVYTGQGKPIKLRLEGIDAPESKQDFGDASKRHLSGLVFSKNVVIHSTGKDRYGRTLGVLHVSDKNVNAMMIRDGFAWHYKQYSSDPELADAEQSARAARRGLWSMANPVAPWEFRRKR
jgi:endonuclease YncB( thermonuclease family)